MPQTLTRECLSEHDRQVLDAIFNPLELTSNNNQSANPDDCAGLIDVEVNPDDEKVRRSKEFETEAVRLAEGKNGGNLDEALRLFEEAIIVAPARASVYNNRAQALRLAGRDDEALECLTKAIELAGAQLRTKCHAHCQRGVLYRKRENLDAARSDFEIAAKMGSNFAKTQLVEINPFAALCNQMLRQAFEQLT